MSLHRLMPALGILLLVQLACRPVFAIGWGELLGIVLITALLLGPIMMRLARSWIKYKESMKKDK